MPVFVFKLFSFHVTKAEGMGFCLSSLNVRMSEFLCNLFVCISECERHMFAYDKFIECKLPSRLK